VSHQCASDLAMEIVSGDNLGFAAAAKLFGQSRKDSSVSPSCVWRWAKHGVEISGGDRVRLEALKLGSRWLTSKGAMQRFLARLQRADQTTSARTTKERSASDADAGRQLQRFGI
jgi:hypothetical protein